MVTGIFRIVLFWVIVAAAQFGLSKVMPFSDWQHVADELMRVAAAPDGPGRFDGVSNAHFAFALASGIMQFAGALAVAFFVCHVLFVLLWLRSARKMLGRSADPKIFADGIEAISARLARNGLVGDAWPKFRDTTYERDGVVHSTVRPQVFINVADARERLFGLKMMPAIPGFFVGTGLLLTFIGLLLALHKAAGATDARSAAEMTGSLNALLKAATFKFATSIAGLGASLLLSLVFRAYQIWIEQAFHAFCHAVETRLTHYPAQKAALETIEILKEQRDELKEINSDRFFTRLGDSVAGNIGTAVGAAMAPVTQRLDTAIAQVVDTSRDGVDELLGRFTESLRGGAGAELGEMARTLGETRAALESIRHDLTGSGSDFARRLNEAAENMARVVEQASRDLGGSASGAAGSVEATMAAVTDRLQGQMTGVAEALAAIQTSMIEQGQAGARRAAEAADAAAEISRQASVEAAAITSEAARETVEAIRSGVGAVIGSLREDIARLSDTLRSVGTAFASQTAEINGVAGRSREAAEAFGRVASDVRTASQPLLAQGERIATSTERMAGAVTASATTLTTTTEAARLVADALTAHFARIDLTWKDYEARFKGVDEDFGRAADRFHEEVSRHQEAMRSFIGDVDQHTKSIAASLGGATDRLAETFEALHETLEDFLERTAQRPAAK